MSARRPLRDGGHSVIGGVVSVLREESAGRATDCHPAGCDAGHHGNFFAWGTRPGRVRLSVRHRDAGCDIPVGPVRTAGTPGIGQRRRRVIETIH